MAKTKQLPRVSQPSKPPYAPHESYMENKEDYDDDGRDPKFNDLAMIYESDRRPLYLTAHAGLDWTTIEAFRELVQNWRDTITNTYRLSFEEFKPQKTVRKCYDNTIIEYAVRHPLTDVVLGYVTFTYGKDKEGEIEITNYGSSLEPWHLQMGATTKQYDPLQSGQFGEGLKRAIVTFRRKPNHHTFRIVSSNYNWSFGWDINGMLNLNLFKIEPQKIENERQKNISKPRSTWQFRRFEEGVSIIIGQKHLKYSKSDTKEYTGNKIRLGDFEIMVKSSSIVLERPESFETPVGSIILSSEYGNKLFSDGLSVRRIDQNRVPFLYGYDLHNAPSAQDRTFLRDPTELTTAVNNIWAHACRMEPKMVIRYTELIVNNINNLPDVSLDPTSDGLPLDVARLVWAELLSRKPPTKGGLAPFYYVEIGNSEDSVLIESTLKRDPVAINRDLWSILRNHNLCRSIAEETRQAVSEAVLSNPPEQRYARHVRHFLKCCLQTFDETREIILLCFKGLNLSSHYDQHTKTWWLNTDWLQYDLQHSSADNTSFCRVPNPETGAMFACDHVVLRFWDELISDLQSKRILQCSERLAYMKDLADYRIRQTPRSITCTATNEPDELIVQWDFLEQKRVPKDSIITILHSLDCEESALIHRDDDQAIPCKCQRHISKVEGGCTTGIRFSGLDPQKKYSPKVAFNEDMAFYALCSDNSSPIGGKTTPSGKETKKDSITPRMGNAMSSTMEESSRAGQVLLHPIVLESRKGAKASSVIDTSGANQAENLKKSSSDDMEGYRPIHCKDLPWEEGFPSSYNWFRKNGTESPSLLAKPKTQGQPQGRSTAGVQEEESSSEPSRKRRCLRTARRSSRLTNRRISYRVSSDPDNESETQSASSEI